MSFIDEYIAYQKKYEKIYGINTIVLLECGTFFEIYSKEEGKLDKITSELNIQLTRKNKNKASESTDSNPYMAGIPSWSLTKYLEKLSNLNYCIVIIEQVTPPPKPKRELTQIITPGTNINTTKDESNFLMSIFVEEITDYKTKLKTNFFGVSVIDITTGELIVYESDDIYSFIHIYKPNEILLYNLTDDDIIDKLELKHISTHKFDKIDNNIKKISYVNDFFSKIYKDHGILKPIEYLDLEFKNYILTSLILLLNYINNLNNKLIKNLDKPKIWKKEELLNLRNNTLYQLNIIPNNSLQSYSKINSLFDIIINTSTCMGKRELKKKILNPLLDVNKLNNIYNFVEKLIDTYEEIENELRYIRDIQRLHKKLELGIITINEFGKLNTTYQCIIRLLNIIKEKYLTNYNHIFDFDLNKIIVFFNEFYEDYKKNYNINNLTNDNGENIFNKNICPELDELQKKISDNLKYLMDLVIELNEIGIQKDKKFNVKLEYNEKDLYYISITEKRAELLKPLVEHMNLNFIKQNSNVVKIKSVKIKQISEKIFLGKDKMKNLVKFKFKESIKKYQNYSDEFKNLNKIIIEIDILKSYAKMAKLNNYCKPKIIDNNQTSFIRCKKLRHPIIERIQIDIEYITNDIELNEEGILLFGPNATGKSSIMKSVGIAVIMAQCGMFVSCSEMEYYPYKNIFSRIIGCDNIFKGQSSFAIEMLELKTILDNSDKNSLILGDEICRGTEDISGISLVAVTVEELALKKSSFIFTTHLHKLPELEIIKKLDNVKSYHLTIDVKDDEIIYLRKLVEGPGNAIYGLEIAKNILKNNNFIMKANEIRNNLLDISNNILNTETSNYNNDVFVHNCAICNEKATETHHIKFQKEANKDGFIDTIHKDNKSNLVNLCEKHHLDVHHNKIIINGYQQTSEGRKLDYYFTNNIKKNRRYNESQVSKIKEYIQENNIEEINGAVENTIRDKFNIKITKKTIEKIAKDLY